MAKNIKSILEITDAHVKFIQAKVFRSKVVVNACEIRAFAHFTDDEIVKLVSECVYTKNVPHESLIVVLPRRWAILKQISLPSHQEGEIDKMLRLQLVNQIPYPIEDVICGHSIIEKLPTGYAKALAVVVQKETAKKYLSLVSRSGIHAGKLYLSSNALLEWVLFQEQAKALDARLSLCVINIDFAGTEVCFLNDRKLYFSRQFQSGARDLNSDNLLSFYEQIELSFQAYKRDLAGPEPKKVIIIATLSETSLLKEKIEKEMKIPVDIYSGIENVMSQRATNLSSLKNQSGISLAIPLGFLLSELSKPANLTPQEIRDTKKSNQRRKELIKLALLMFLVLGVSLFGVGIKLYQKSVVVGALEAEAALTKDKISSAQKKVDFANQLDSDLKNRVFLPDVIAELYRLAPPTVSFRSIQLVERTQFSIQGYAELGAGVTEFHTKMLKSSVFKNVSLQFATKRRIFNSEVTDFKINCELVAAPNTELP